MNLGVHRPKQPILEPRAMGLELPLNSGVVQLFSDFRARYTSRLHYCDQFSYCFAFDVPSDSGNRSKVHFAFTAEW